MMIVLHSSSTRAAPRAERPGLWAALRFAVAWPGRVMEARRLAHQFAAMSDHELADIGLLRQDLRDLSAWPAHEDPGDRLEARARARRRRRG